jgi:hypothetical protein
VDRRDDRVEVLVLAEAGNGAGIREGVPLVACTPSSPGSR